uniref:uncharacterized protein n=1 Tax=Myxine glutinosa TaxID=7769 RepID=UPI00358F17A9
MSINLSYSSLSSDEEYSPGHCNVNDFHEVPQELYNELNIGLNNLPLRWRAQNEDTDEISVQNDHPSLTLNTTPVEIDDHGYEWVYFDFLPTCDTLNFHLDSIDTKLNFLEKEIQNLKTSAEPTFDLCWEEIDDLCWGELECIPQKKCFVNIKILFSILYEYICFTPKDRYSLDKITIEKYHLASKAVLTCTDESHGVYSSNPQTQKRDKENQQYGNEKCHNKKFNEIKGKEKRKINVLSRPTLSSGLNEDFWMIGGR